MFSVPLHSTTTRLVETETPYTVDHGLKPRVTLGVHYELYPNFVWKLQWTNYRVVSFVRTDVVTDTEAVYGPSGVLMAP